MNSDWKYMWSIVRGARQGDIYEKHNESDWLDVAYKVVLIQSGKEVPTPETTDVEYEELDYCRILAEDFIMQIAP